MVIKDLSAKERKGYFAEKMRNWRFKNREKDLAHKKKWRDNNKDKRKKYDDEFGRKMCRDYYYKNKEKFNQSKEYIRNYMKKYLEDEGNHYKYLVRQRDYHKIRTKLLALFGECQNCGSKEKLELHHEDYFVEGRVLILCIKCHRYLHRLK